MQDELANGTGKLLIGKDTLEITPQMATITKETKMVSSRYAVYLCTALHKLSS